MKKIIFGLSICVWVMFALVATTAPPAVAQEVYLMPQQSSASYCNTTSVDIWVNATSFQSGQIELTYNPFYAHMTDWVRNTTNFPMGGWTHIEDGKDRINFMGSAPKTGEYMIGTLTIHCVNERREGCVTTLDFTEHSKLFDDHGSTVPANWIDGTFECKSLLDGGTESPVEQTPTTGGNTHTRISGGNLQSKDGAEAEAEAIVPNSENETYNEDVDTRAGAGIHPESDATHEEEPTTAAQMPQGQESMFLIMIIAIALVAVTAILIFGIIGIRRRWYRK